MLKKIGGICVFLYDSVVSMHQMLERGSGDRVWQPTKIFTKAKMIVMQDREAISHYKLYGRDKKPREKISYTGNAFYDYLIETSARWSVKTRNYGGVKY